MRAQLTKSAFLGYNARMRWFFALLLLFLSTPVFAGGPLVVDTVKHSGTAATWANNKLTWYVDKGDLSSNVTRDEAVEWIKQAFATWTGASMQNAEHENIQVVNLEVVFGGVIDEDVSPANITDYDNEEPGKTVIILDKDGLITESLQFDKTGIVGLATPLLVEGTSLRKGIALFNGFMLENGRLDPDPEVAKQRFQSTILHELGHLLNIDHTQVNLDLGLQCTIGGICNGSQDIPTMYPELKSHMQTVLARDDKIALALLYPSDKFFSSFCTAIGKIEDADGKPLRGVNVVASRVNDGEKTTRVDARSFVSGAFYGDDDHQCMNNSQYVLAGLVPGKTYKVVYEALTTQYTDHSGFRPLISPPTGFPSRTVPSAKGSNTISCSKGGQVIELKTVQIDTANPCSKFLPVSEQITVLPTEPADDEGSSAPKTGSSGGCTLVLPH